MIIGIIIVGILFLGISVKLAEGILRIVLIAIVLLIMILGSIFGGGDKAAGPSAQNEIQVTDAA